MAAKQWRRIGRRWPRWILCGLLAWAGDITAGSAGEVFRCSDVHGAVVYRDRPCASGEAEVVVLAPAPHDSASPAPAPRSAATPARQRSSATASRGQTSARTETSYECRSSDGQVFYRHRACPKSIAAADRQRTSRNGRTHSSTVAVTSVAVPREVACREMRRAAAVGPSGRQHDDDVSTYDKNLGHDPCA